MIKYKTCKLDNAKNVMELINFTWMEQSGVLFYPYDKNKVESIGRIEYLKGLNHEGDLFMADWYASEFDYVEAILEFCKGEINNCNKIAKSYGGFGKPGTLIYAEEKDRYNNICNELNCLLA